MAMFYILVFVFLGTLTIVKGTVYYFGDSNYFWNPSMNEVMEIQDFDLTGAQVGAYNQDSCVLNDDCLRMSELEN